MDIEIICLHENKKILRELEKSLKQLSLQSLQISKTQSMQTAHRKLKQNLQKNKIIALANDLSQCDCPTFLQKISDDFPQVAQILLVNPKETENLLPCFNAGNIQYCLSTLDLANETHLAVNKALAKLTSGEQDNKPSSHTKSELEIAQEIQKSLLKPPAPQFKSVEAYCYSNSAKLVGGDFYTYSGFENKQALISKINFCIGDVSGKGISAALIMATCLSQIDASFALKFRPEERMAYLDQKLTPYTSPKKQNCAASIVELSATNSNFPIAKIANAGGIPPYIKKKNGDLVNSKTRGFSLGVGFGSKLGYKAKSFPLAKGDSIVMLSDGVVEAVNPQKELLGFDGVETLLQSCPAELSPKAAVEFIRTEVEAFCDGEENQDDLTILAIKLV
ncbi:MAG: PP2C family protein-serine/threonine phosphatase [Spirochaetota bacterium]